MRVLALDTALNRCAVAIVEDGRVRAHLSEPMRRGHAERLAPMVQEALAAADLSGLDRIATTTGPGSFTGLRVGLAFARGLALARGVECVGVSSLEALALEAGDAGDRAAAIEAPGGVYFALYRDGATLIAPARFDLEDARAILRRHPGARVRGPGAGALGGDVIDAPDARVLALRAGGLDSAAHPPRPLYLRAPDAKPHAAPGTAT